MPSTQTKAEATQSTVLPRAAAVEWARKVYEQDAVICEANVTYTRHGGSTVEVPAVTIFRLKNSATGPLAYRVQMFVDLAPLFGGS